MEKALLDTVFPKVVEKPVLWGDSDKPQPAGRYKALVDDRTGQIFSIVTKDYRLITHERAIEQVEGCLMDCRDLEPYKTKTEFYHEGARMLRTYDFPGISINIAPNDPVNLSLLLYNSYDRKWPFVVILGAYRIICSNGLVVGRKYFHIRQRHIFQLREIDLETNIGTALRRFSLQAKRWKRMAERNITRKIYDDVMAKMDLGVTAAEWIEDQIKRVADRIDDGLPVISIWKFYNVFTAYISHHSASLNHRVELESRLRSALEHIRLRNIIKHYKMSPDRMYIGRS